MEKIPEKTGRVPGQTLTEARQTSRHFPDSLPEKHLIALFFFSSGLLQVLKRLSVRKKCGMRNEVG
jgi:hypothetical protein